MNTNQSECLFLRKYYKLYGCNTPRGDRTTEVVIGVCLGTQLRFEPREIRWDVVDAFIHSTAHRKVVRAPLKHEDFEMLSEKDIKALLEM